MSTSIFDNSLPRLGSNNDTNGSESESPNTEMLLCWIIFKNLVATTPDIFCKQIMYNRCFFKAMEQNPPTLEATETFENNGKTEEEIFKEVNNNNKLLVVRK